MQSLFGSKEPNDPIVRALTQADIAEQAGPWQPVTTMGIGGLIALGFDRTSETVLVCSANGQSVMSGETGEVLYRNRDEDGLDVSTLKGTRLDHPAGERFDMAGLYGGGLRSVTDDGWSIYCLHNHAILHPPNASIHFAHPKWQGTSKDASFHLIDRSGEDIRAFGFSWSSHTLVFATSSILKIWHRPSPLKL